MIAAAVRRTAALASAVALLVAAVPLMAGADPSSAAAPRTKTRTNSANNTPKNSPNPATTDTVRLPNNLPIPTPPKKYSNTAPCVSASDSTARLRNGVSWAQRQLAYTSLWQLADRGSGQTVAVIDTGVNPVSALAGRLTAGGDFVQQGGSGLSDCDGHGTIVASLVAGSPDPRSGFSGVAPNARIIGIRQSSQYFGVPNAKNGSGDQTAGNLSSLAQAIRYAADEDATVINVSEANCRPATPSGELSARASGIDQAVRYAISKDVVVVVAAGNLAQDTPCGQQNTPGAAPRVVPSPADVPGVLAVGAIDQAGIPTAFSIAGPWVGVAAPGVDIIGTNPVVGSSGQINELINGNGVSPIQGTSFAAPYVAGVVALVRERFPGLTAPQVVERVERTAQHPAAPSGRNDYVGFGIVDPRAALTATLPGEGDQAVVQREGPQTLPLAHPHPDPEHSARLVALVGALAVLVVVTAGAIATTTRRRAHRAPAASPRRALPRR